MNLNMDKQVVKKKVAVSKETLKKKVPAKKEKQKTVKKKVSKVSKKDKKKSGKVIIEREKESSNEEEKYSQQISLVISKIKEKSMLESDNKIRFGWKW